MPARISKSTALYRGRISVRPWRIGVLVDIDAPDQVADAISQLSGVWGGFYMPILDITEDFTNLRSHIQAFDLDSVYAESASDELNRQLRDSRLGWRGRGRNGPFVGEPGLRSGLLPADALVASGGLSINVGEWRGPAEPELVLAAHLGCPLGGGSKKPRPVLETTRLLSLADNSDRNSPRGVAVIRSDSVRDVVWFWNCRSMLGDVLPFVADSPEFNIAVLAELKNADHLAPARISPGGSGDAVQVPVWGFDDLSSAETQRLELWATERGVQLVPRARDHALVDVWFPGFERIKSGKFRVEARPTERLIPVDIPRLALRDTSTFLPGIIAAELNFHQASGVDPRLTVAIPPHRRHSVLIERPGHGAEQVRISAAGPVFGVQADLEEISIPNVYQVDVMRLLFDEEALTTNQSDEGKFQTRAAELLGGPLSGYLAQPGVREAIQQTGSKQTGITLQQLRGIVSSHRGEWPDSLYAFGQTPKEYAEQQVNLLLNSGIFVPTLRIQCHECRIHLRLSPEQIGATIQCEFCGDDIRLALALALSKPEWTYHLAGHLSASRMKAFLPAMAASAVLGSLSHTEGPPASHVFGLEVDLPNRGQVEVDIAMILHEHGWIVILGEVKSHSRIDSNDAANLFNLCGALVEKGVVAIPLFATFNEAFAVEEQLAIRAALELAPRSASLHGQRFALAPLLLTLQDMSLPNYHEDHPWRWSKPGSGTGVVGIALESAKRHLGLADVSWADDEEGRPRFKWVDLQSTAE